MLDITIVAFAHHKGGTGKTTSCLNVAGYLQKDGKSVLVVDCDPQANATAGLGVNPETLELSMYDVFMSAFEGFPDVVINDIIVPTASGVDLAPATLDLVGVEPYLYGIEDRAGLLKEALARVRGNYDFILIDTPPSMGQFVINGLIAADHTVVTLDPGTFALRGMEALSTVFGDIREMLGEDVAADFAILTRWKGSGDRAAGTSGLALFLKRIFSPGPSVEEEKERERLKVFEAEVRRSFKQVFAVPYSPAIYETQQKGLPISHYAPESEAGREYRAITTALLALDEDHDEV
ncbi:MULTISPECIES: AAA family ATPase [unclassified Methanoculleus]|uniref:ParA family protein n=1 Tax=unclassified Methanoculleus TaxID=2619537 RepID=UPI0025D6D9D7|nr:MULTISPECIES: AAA family ATPase [unclassified Methanoculleus]MCK9317323.1 AAA family ATPase [Methanoculleus sp.]MDD2253025.1 AAA family ATPase [Methanoculleus sp.]MDD2786621.1 AAA family ATPase [Methanoculleus sp.]MDD3216244.1 AAA family ATPase [Methanoculleus sp.]MDD4313871.1 AAA family ATPase [Methanoculleus sp.]